MGKKTEKLLRATDFSGVSMLYRLMILAASDQKFFPAFLKAPKIVLPGDNGVIAQIKFLPNLVNGGHISPFAFLLMCYSISRI